MPGVIRQTALVGALLAVLGAAASAQDVLMNSAETIDQGNFKLALFPTALLGRHGGQDDWGGAGRAGLGLTRSFDVEAKAAVFEGLRYFGGDAELWLARDSPLDVSAAVGLHKTDREAGEDSSGLDVALLASTEVAPRLELYGGARIAFESLAQSGREYKIVHVVPGLEYRVRDDLDFLAEVGIALNDDSRSYVSVGLALYLR